MVFNYIILIIVKYCLVLLIIISLFFSNSLLFEITIDVLSSSDVIFAKKSWYRSKIYQIYTIIKENNSKIKISKYQEAYSHLDNMISIHQKLKELGLNVANVEKEKDEYKVELISGGNLYEYLYLLAKKQDKNVIL